MEEERLRRALREAVIVDPPAHRRRRLRIRGVALLDAAEVGLAIVLFFVGDNFLTNAPGLLEPVAVLLSFLSSGALLLRRRQPLVAWAVAAWTTVVGSAFTTPYPPTLGIVYLLCLYSVALRCRREATIAIMLLTTMAIFVIDWQTAAFVLVCAVPVLLGYTVRVRRIATTTLVAQEARHASETAVLAERQRIARELHDVVAHHMSVIAIQAEAAPYKVADPPPELAESFAYIRASALDGLTELRRVLGVLRTEDAAQTAPQPGLDRLDEVAASARGGGLDVRTSVSGQATVLPAGVGLSAYRILQEALSNVMRHAPGASVRIEVGYEPTVLRLRVANAPADRPPPVPAPGGGHGLTGMRERASMLGGELTAGPTSDGGFAVAAALPLEKT